MTTLKIQEALAFLRTLQRSPEPVRKKWQRGASAIAMGIIVIGWVFYLNASLTPERAAKTDTAAPEESSLFDTFRKGFEVLSSSIEEGWGALRGTTETLWSSFGANLANPTTLTFIREEPAVPPEPFEAIPSRTLPVFE